MGPFHARTGPRGAVAARAEGNLRDLALSNLGVDVMLCASDILWLRVEDVTDHTGAVIEEFTLWQKKTQAGIVVAVGTESCAALAAWIAASGKKPGDFLFTGIGNRSKNSGRPLSRWQYAHLVKQRAAYARLDPRRYSTHSMRRTKSAAIYAATLNVTACQQLLGHKSISSTAAYLGVGQRQGLDLAKSIEV